MSLSFLALIMFTLFYRGICRNKRISHRSNLNISAMEYHLVALEASIKATNYHKLRDLIWSWSPMTHLQAHDVSLEPPIWLSSQIDRFCWDSNNSTLASAKYHVALLCSIRIMILRKPISYSRST